MKQITRVFFFFGALILAATQAPAQMHGHMMQSADGAVQFDRSTAGLVPVQPSQDPGRYPAAGR